MILVQYNLARDVSICKWFDRQLQKRGQLNNAWLAASKPAFAELVSNVCMLKCRQLHMENHLGELEEEFRDEL